MHDPLCVAHQIKYPWRARDSVFPAYHSDFVTIWHRDPGGYDSGDRCKFNGRWRWHMHHWRLQVHPYQRIRTALTRCEHCHQRFGMHPGSRISCGWDDPRSCHRRCYDAWQEEAKSD